jgi:hypothetical protein
MAPGVALQASSPSSFQVPVQASAGQCRPVQASAGQCRQVQASAGQCQCGTCPRYLPQVPPHPWYLYPPPVSVPCAPVVAWPVPPRMFPHRSAPEPTFWPWLSSRPPLLSSVSSPIFIILHRCRNYSFFSSSLTSLSFTFPHHTTNRIRRYSLTIQVTNVCVFPFVRRPLDSGPLA